MCDAPLKSAPISPREAEKLDAEIENLRASAEKTRLDKLIAEESRGKVAFLRNVPATQYTLFLALLTLLIQIVQSGCNSIAQRRATEDKQWRETIAAASFTEGEKAVRGALAFQGFYNSTRYGDDARSMVASILPSLSNSGAFDKIFNNLRRSCDLSQSGYLYDVSKSVTTLYSDDYVSVGFERNNAPSFFREQLSSVRIAPTESVEHQWTLREWEIDTITRGLVDFWKQNGTRPKGYADVHSYSADLRGVVLRQDDNSLVDLSNLDFSNADFKSSYLSHASFKNAILTGANLRSSDMSTADLTGTHLDCAILDQTDLSNLTSMAGSTWKHTIWSQAMLSPALQKYLQKNYPEEDEAKSLAACGSRPE